jgi:hypothetical protein
LCGDAVDLKYLGASGAEAQQSVGDACSNDHAAQRSKIATPSSAPLLFTQVNDLLAI